MHLLACNLITLQSFLNLNHQLLRSTSIKPVFHFSRIIPKHSLFLCFLSNDFGYFKFLDLKKNWKLALKLHWKDLCCCSNFEKCSNLYAYQQHLKRKCYGTLRYGWNGKQALIKDGLYIRFEILTLIIHMINIYTQFWLAKSCAIVSKYSAKKWNTMQISLTMAGIFSRFSIKIIYINPLSGNVPMKMCPASLLFYSVLCQTISLVRGRVLPLNELKLTISHVTYARMWLHNFSCVLFISNSMVSCAIWKNIQSCEFFKDFKLHLSFGLMQFWSSLRHGPMKILMHVFPNCTWNHTTTYTNILYIIFNFSII
jgi:hypothetical protein